MLSDREREELADIERELLVKEPKLTRRFEDAAKTQQAHRNRKRRLRYDWVLELLIGLTLLVTALAILLGDLGLAAGFATLSGSVAVVRHWLGLSKRLSD